MGSVWKKAWGSVAFAVLATALAPLAQDLSTDDEGKPIYVPKQGSETTFSVAAPLATPTLVYNCAAMPLICENVGSYARKVQNPGGNGDLNGLPVFHFDPSNDDKTKRRSLSCGCFEHDTCPEKLSNGKQSELISDIAGQWAANNGFSAISQQDRAIILAGPNPSYDKITKSLNPKVPQNAIPGQFSEKEWLSRVTSFQQQHSFREDMMQRRSAQCLIGRSTEANQMMKAQIRVSIPSALAKTRNKIGKPEPTSYFG